MSLLTANPSQTLEVQSLDFDTRLFGAKLGSVVRLGERAASSADTDAQLLAWKMGQALARARTDGFAHVIFRADAEDLASIWAAERCGLRLVDIGVDSSFHFDSTPLPDQPASPLIRAARPDDMPPLQDLASVAFVRSRFVVDPFFAPDYNVL